MSRILGFEIEGFMSVKDKQVVTFDDSNIIDLCGYNDSGKSAVTTGVEVLLYDAYPNEQVNFINDDEEYFCLSAIFDDGVRYTRYKYIDGKSVYEMYKDEVLMYSNRQADGTVLSMNGIPDVIRKYLGVIIDETTGEKLNVRRNRDRLLLINTSGGDNYKILNAVLMSDVLSDASKGLNEDKNRLQSELLNDSNKKDTLVEELNLIQVIPDDALNILKEKTKNLTTLKQKYDYIMSLVDKRVELSKVIVHDELNLVDTSRLAELDNIVKLRKSMDIDIPLEVKGVDTRRLETMQEIIKLRKSLDVPVFAECKEVNTTRLKDIRELGTLANSLYQTSQDINAIDTTLNEINIKVKNMAIELKKEGKTFSVCRNCGTLNIANNS